MQIINRLFPYPVLSIDIDDYKSNNFTIDLSVSDNDNRNDSISLNVNVNLDNKAIIYKINKGDIDIVIHLECPKTSYRQLFNMQNKQSEDFIISKKFLNGKLEICCMLIASKKLIIDKSTEICNDYNNATFEVDRGCILGYYNAGSITIDKANDELVKPSSIFSVVKKIGSEDPLSVNLDDSNRIKIILNENYYAQFNRLNNNKLLPVLHSIIVLPTLIYVLERLKEAKGDFEQYEEKLWFRALDKQLIKLKIDLNKDDLNNHESIVVAQQLLQLPINKSLNLLVEMGDE